MRASPAAVCALATGYAKRFWKQGRRYLGETRYLDGNLLVKHSLEEITIDLGLEVTSA